MGILQKIFSLFQSNRMEIKEVMPQQALQALEQNQAVMIDVREPSEVAAASYQAPNMLHIPLGSLETQLASIPKDKPLIMACRSGARSYRAAGILLQHGFTDVVNLSGGILNWQANGMPVKVG
jgi:rhodanese-related sulfurtransferase